MIVHFDSFQRNEQLASITLVFIGNWAAACYNCSWFYPEAGYELRLSRVPAAQVTIESSSGGWIQVTAESILRLTRVPAAGYGCTMADLSSGNLIRVTADCILRLIRVLAAGYDLRLIQSCGWLRVAADSSPPAGLDFRLTYTLIYQVIWRTYSAKYITFMVCFLPTDFSYHWSRLWLLLQ